MSVPRLAVLITFCLGQGFAIARTIVVPTEYATIQGAVNVATAGDVISIQPGTYRESVTILDRAKAGISLQGSNAATTIVNPGGTGRGISVLIADNVSISNLTISGGLASGSVIPEFGGGIFVDGSNNVTISSCVMINNTAMNGGGFASRNSTVTLTGNTISANRAASATEARGGGVFMYQTSGQVSNNVISDNTTSGPNAAPGGGLFLQLSNPAVSGNTISGNQTSGAQHYGGGLYILESDNFSISKNSFTGNKGLDGGGIFVGSSINVMLTLNTIANNAAVNGGGLASQNSTLTLTGNTIDANRAASATDARGGGAFMYLTHGQVSNNVFSNNTTSGPNMGPGGGLFLQKSNPSVSSNTFSGNQASGAQHYGGGLYIYDSTDFTVSENTFDGNKGLDGGGMAIIGTDIVYAHPTYSNPTVTGNIFSRNDARWGGGLYGWHMSSRITNNIFSQNTAGLRVPGFLSGGGGILFDESPDAVFAANIVTDNTALDWGGGINVYKSSPIISRNTVSRNQSGNGGGIAITPDSDPAVSGNAFTDNIATQNGGGMIIGDNSNAIVKNNLFARNRATDSGGGIVVFSASSPQIINNTFFSNRGQENWGGTVRTDSSSPTLMNNVFYGVAAAEAISANASTVQLLYNDFWNNKSNYLNLSSIISQDAGNRTLDPKFADVTKDNFLLHSSSPARNAGNPNASYNNPDGTRNTLGMYGGPGAFTLQSDCFFGWAERTHPSVFGPAGTTSNLSATFHYRYYSQTNAFLATNSADNHLYYLGPLSGDSIFDAGTLSSWLATAGCQ